MDLSMLTQSLGSYSQKALARSGLVTTALTPLAYVLAGIFFALELAEFNKRLNQNGGEMNARIFFDYFYKYLVCFVMIANSRLIFDTIMALGVGAVNLIDAKLPKETYDMAVDLGKVKGVMKTALNILGWGVEGISQLSIKIITMMRFFYLYVFRSVSPLMYAFFMHETTRTITIGFLKKLGAISFQAVLIIVVVRLFPTLVTTDLLKVSMSKNYSPWSAAFSSIAKGALFILVIWGTEKKSKELLNAM